MNTPLINDDPATWANALAPAGHAYGLVPRDYAIDPPEMFAGPEDIKVIPRSEWDARIDEQEKQQSSLEHIYLAGGWENLDQNGDGYCWMFSNGHACMLLRAVANQPYVRLNPHSSAAIIKGGRNEGGWCGLGAKFLRETGMAPEGNGPGQWPLHSRSLSHDTPAMRQEMAKYRVVEDYYDLTRPVHGQVMTFDQVATCLLLNIPVPVDFNWWGHSVCAVRLIRIEAGSYGLRILNSWKGWGRRGLGDLQGTRAVPNGAIALRVVRPAA